MGGTLSTILNGDFDGIIQLPSFPRVITIDSKEDWENKYKKIKESSKLVVIHFTASWCGRCKTIAPDIQNMVKLYNKDVQFYRIDIDQLKKVAKKYGVDVTPTFVLLKKDKEVGRIIGAKMEDLKNKIEEQKDPKDSTSGGLA